MEAIRQGPVIVMPKLKQELSVRGSKIIARVRSGDTDGEYSVVEETVPPGGGTPFHVHCLEDEIFYVLEGEFEVQSGERTFIRKKGRSRVGAEKCATRTSKCWHDTGDDTGDSEARRLRGIL
jgi:quercetin dioxygenase-like cupin family protein